MKKIDVIGHKKMKKINYTKIRDINPYFAILV